MTPYPKKFALELPWTCSPNHPVLNVNYIAKSVLAQFRWIMRSSDGGHGETQGLITPPPGWFLHNYYTFVSLHDSDHEGVVRIFVALSCEQGTCRSYYSCCTVLLLYSSLLHYKPVMFGFLSAFKQGRPTFKQSGPTFEWPWGRPIFGRDGSRKYAHPPLHRPAVGHAMQGSW